MPRDASLRTVMVIGSGPIVIGQAAEFDYAGTQACRALREEGVRIVLINSNPATIMTDPELADRIYLEPLTPEFCAKVIERERPDGLLPTLGGQTGLNLAAQLAEMGVLDAHGVRMLGTPLHAIQDAEDRARFKALMRDIGEPVPPSETVVSVAEADRVAQDIGYPVIVRPAYTLGGTGGGIARDARTLRTIVQRGLEVSMIGQVLIEQCLTGWKEIEYEVIRDAAGTGIVVCNMENFDPMGIHTGDSIVIAPSQTLSDREYHLLRRASLNIIRALGVEGGCNVQLALDPHSEQYFVIEVNPRVSRSSALASKATGYPIARVAAKIAVGLRLDEIPNAVTGETLACFEPALDYCVVKIPRWPFDKFRSGDRTIGTQMKATGEVMAIAPTFEQALQKAVRSLETGQMGLFDRAVAGLADDQIEDLLRRPTDQRLWAIAEAFRRGQGVAEVQRHTHIDPWFLTRVRNLVRQEEVVREGLEAPHSAGLKALGFSDAEGARLADADEEQVRAARQAAVVRPVFKMVDTCAAEFDARTPYFYSAYPPPGTATESEAAPTARRKAIVIGSGPIRIGQGIEFDYCCVHSAWALREAGYEAILINSNPETVSTDFDTSDRLYFEPLTAEDVLEVIERERPEGVIVQFGGQTALNLAEALQAAGVLILGTAFEDIDRAENRARFDDLLHNLGIPRPQGVGVRSVAEGLEAARGLGLPVVVRPSYVLGGAAMVIVYSEEQLADFLAEAALVSPAHPVLVDRYVTGIEVEVDLLCDGERVCIPGVMEHIERSGVHSGDSMAVYPPVTLSQETIATLAEYATRIARALHVRGVMNLQAVVADGQVLILEVNPRASRTVPFLSKATGIPMVHAATQMILGKSLRDLGLPEGLVAPRPYYAVKAPVFSFSKLAAVDIALGPEMKSTGEIMAIDPSYPRALYKALLAADIGVRDGRALLATIADRDKDEALPLLAGFHEAGYRLYATTGTARLLAGQRIPATPVKKLSEGTPNVVDLIASEGVDVVINTTSLGRRPDRDGARIRRASVEHGVPCLTSLDTVRALLTALQGRGDGEMGVKTLQEYLGIEAAVTARA